MKFASLRYYCTIVEQEQISRAAKLLNISQPPLSNHLKELEEELETTLIIRTGGKWEVTFAGHMLYDYAKEVLSQREKAVARIRNANKGYGVPLSIGTSSFCVPFLQAAVPCILEQYADTLFRIVVEDSTTISTHLQHSAIDAALLALPFEATDHHMILLKKLELKAIFPSRPEFMELPEPLPLTELQKHTLLLPRRPGLASYDRILAFFHSAGIYPQIRMECTDLWSLLNFVETGIGAAIIPALPAPSMNKFVIRGFSQGELSMQMAILYRRDTPVAPPLQLLVETLQQQFGA